VAYVSSEWFMWFRFVIFSNITYVAPQLQIVTIDFYNKIISILMVGFGHLMTHSTITYLHLGKPQFPEKKRLDTSHLPTL